MGPAPSQYNVLRMVLEALGSPTLPTQHPHMYEQCLELVHDLAAAPDTGVRAGSLAWLHGQR